MLGGALAVTAALFTLGPIGGLDVDARVEAATSVRTIDEEVRPSTVLEPVVQNRQLAEVVATPRLALENDARTHFVLTYAPTLRVPWEPSPPGLPEGQASSPLNRASLLHVGDLRVDSAEGGWDWRAGARATYGWLDPISQGAVGGGQPVLSTQRLAYRAYVGSVGSTYHLGRAESVSLDVQAGASGGDDAAAEAALPIQRDARADATFEWRLSTRDVVSALASVGGARIDRRGDALTLQGGGFWDRALTRQVGIRLGGGVAGAGEWPERESGTPESAAAPASMVAVAPWGTATVTYIPGGDRPSLAVTTGTLPQIDRLRASVDLRVFVEGRSEWAFAREWLLGVSGQGAVVEPWLGSEVTGGGRVLNGSATVRLGHELGRHLAMSGDLSATWQGGDRQDVATFRELAATVSVVATLPR